MTPERWQKVRDVLEQALELASEKRSRFLEVACSTDPSLRSEVQSLLSANEQARSSFLMSPPIRPSGLTAGTKLGDYEIVSRLGAGGMGIVYRARDLRLGRVVAIKVLAAHLSSDANRLRRFEQEAQATAALNHPNILAVYQLGTHEGAPYFVSELLEGATLREQLKQGALPQQCTMDYGEQIADGLRAAHERSIIHRDLKPENLFVTKDERVKILDFGLAKLAEPEKDSAETVATLGMQTQPGMIAGTIGYMSPEQVRGEKLDVRTDLFSFGVVLYEMVTGKRPFDGDAPGVTFEAILNRQPIPPTRLNSSMSPELERIITRALEKDREVRYQHASDIRSALKRLKWDTDSGRPAASSAVSDEREAETSAKPSSGIQKATPASQPVITEQPRTLPWKILVPVAALIVALIAGGFYWHSRKSVNLTDRDTVVVADFTNMTGDSVFDGTLRQGLAVQLEQSPFLSVVSDQQIQQTLQMMGQKPDVKLTGQIAREICERTASAAVLDGSIAQIGTQYLLTLKAVTCSSGKSLVSTESQASDKNHVIDALGIVSRELRTKLGESLATVQKFDVPLAQATTTSLDALKAFDLGIKAVMGTGGAGASIPFFKHAIELDQNFALAYAYLGTMLSDTGETSIGASYIRKAYEFRDRTSEPEKFFITFAYYSDVTGNLDKAEQTCKLWAAAYPRQAPHFFLGGIYLTLGLYEKGVEESAEAVRLDPDNPYSYISLMFNYLALNRPDEALGIYKQARSRRLDSPQFDRPLYIATFLKRDAPPVEHDLDDKAEVDYRLLATEASMAAYSGRLARARAFSGRAIASAKRAEAKETAAAYETAAAFREALFGNLDEARRRAASAIELSTGQDIVYSAAFVLALTGDTARAKALADDLGKRFPEDTIVQVIYRPTLRAQFALLRSDDSKAIEILTVAVPYELGRNSLSLLPVYVRGLAYLASHQGTQAAAEFEKIAKHRGVVVNGPIGVLTPLQLARAYVIQGDTATAKTAYQCFLTLWKDADPDIPILKRAKAEYAKLQ